MIGFPPIVPHSPSSQSARISDDIVVDVDDMLYTSFVSISEIIPTRCKSFALPGPDDDATSFVFVSKPGAVRIQERG